MYAMWDGYWYMTARRRECSVGIRKNFAISDIYWINSVEIKINCSFSVYIYWWQLVECQIILSSEAVYKRKTAVRIRVTVCVFVWRNFAKLFQQNEFITVVSSCSQEHYWHVILGFELEYNLLLMYIEWVLVFIGSFILCLFLMIGRGCHVDGLDGRSLFSYLGNCCVHTCNYQ